LVRDGEVLTPPVTVAIELELPEGMALTNDGDLMVGEAGAPRVHNARRHELAEQFSPTS
jgi:hypothetical protein